MQSPVRSERDAFVTAVSFVAIGAVAIAAGALVTPALGIVVFVVLAAAGLLLRTRTPEARRSLPLRDAAESPHPDAPAVHPRLLIVANDSLAGADLRAELAGRGAGTAAIEVIAPVLTSHLRLLATDLDGPTERARERLDASLAWLRAQGWVATGHVGAGEPLSAIEDALRDFGPDHVIVFTHPPKGETWQEKREVRRLGDELAIPVVHVASGA
jgi:hypothetical protein